MAEAESRAKITLVSLLRKSKSNVALYSFLSPCTKAWIREKKKVVDDTAVRYGSMSPYDDPAIGVDFWDLMDSRSPGDTDEDQSEEEEEEAPSNQRDSDMSSSAEEEEEEDDDIPDNSTSPSSGEQSDSESRLSDHCNRPADPFPLPVLGNATFARTRSRSPQGRFDDDGNWGLEESSDYQSTHPWSSGGSRVYYARHKPTSSSFPVPSEGTDVGLKTRILVSIKLAGPNYTTWREATVMALRAMDMLSYIDENTPTPPEESIAYTYLKRGNEMVLSWLHNSIDQSLALVNTSGAMLVAHQLWSYLRGRFSPDRGLRKFHLHRDIAGQRQGDSSVLQYFNRLKRLWDELSNSLAKTSCSCGAIKEQQLMQFLIGLNETYGPLRSHILQSDPLPDVDKAFALVLEEEGKRNLSITSLVHQSNSLLNVSVLSTKSPNDDFFCVHCNKPNHTIEDCRKLHGYFHSYNCTEEMDASMNNSPIPVETKGRATKLIKHFAHEHPMILLDENENDEEPCVLCDTWRPGEKYWCLLCKIFIHRFCADVPKRLNHPGHPQHSLTLLLETVTPMRLWCYACDYAIDGSHFYCAYCGFSLHIDCSMLPYSLIHESHPHKLFVSPSTSSGSCNACDGNLNRRISFSCRDCDYELDVKCAFLPRTVALDFSGNKCTLALTYGAKSDNENVEPQRCSFCKNEVETSRWFYFCENPRSVVDVECGISLAGKRLKSLRRAREEMKSLTPADVIYVYKEILHRERMNKEISRSREDTKENKKAEMESWSYKHQHPLVPVDAPANETFCTWCHQLLSGSVYGCSQCNGILMHKLCYEAPKETKHPCHPEHLLTLMPRTRGHKWCTACENRITGTAFCCNPCEIFLHPECALLPLEVEYKEHRHLRFKMIYKIEYDYPNEDHEGACSDEYYCIHCEKQIDEKWAYRCAVCSKYVAHLACLAPSALPSRKQQTSADRKRATIVEENYG